MASQLTREEVQRIAELARLTLTPDEATRFARELTAILEYAADISTVNTASVPASTGTVSASSREDQARPSLPRETVIEQAPDAAPGAGLFRVPKVL